MRITGISRISALLLLAFTGQMTMTLAAETNFQRIAFPDARLEVFGLPGPHFSKKRNPFEGINLGTGCELKAAVAKQVRDRDLSVPKKNNAGAAERETLDLLSVPLSVPPCDFSSAHSPTKTLGTIYSICRTLELNQKPIVPEKPRHGCVRFSLNSNPKLLAATADQDKIVEPNL